MSRTSYSNGPHAQRIRYQVIRSAEYVRGYFDGEGCVRFNMRPTNWGRGAGLVIETTDLDVMRDLVETFISWGVRATHREHPPRIGATRPTARVNISSRAGVEAVLARIRPMRVKHEARLNSVFAFWAAHDRLQSAPATGEHVVKEGLTYKRAALIAGVSFKQLANSIAYSKRTGRTRVRPLVLRGRNPHQAVGHGT